MRKMKQGVPKPDTKDAIWQFMIDHSVGYKHDSGTWIFHIESTGKENLWWRIGARRKGLYFFNEKGRFQSREKFNGDRKAFTFKEKLVNKIYWKSRNFLVARDIEFY
jgi:hypothetical protein